MRLVGRHSLRKVTAYLQLGLKFGVLDWMRTQSQRNTIAACSLCGTHDGNGMELAASIAVYFDAQLMARRVVRCFRRMAAPPTLQAELRVALVTQERFAASARKTGRLDLMSGAACVLMVQTL